MDKIKQIGFKAGEKPRRPVIQADTSASKSYASIAYGISEGEIVGLVDGAKSILLDGTPVMSSSGDINIPDVTVQERKGTNDQTHLEGFPAVVNEKQYNNIEMLFSTPFVHYINDTNLDAVGIRFTFGALQSTNPDNGDVSGTTIEYAIDVQVDGQGYQELLRTNIVGKYSAGYQRYHRVELPPAEEGWEVRIRRLTPNSTSTYIADKMYLDAVAEILDVKMRYPNTALIGLKFDSERFSNIPKVDFRMRGKIIRVPANYDPVTRTYAQSGEGTTNGIWNGQFKMAYTTNPAWIFYDLVLNKRYGLGNRIDPSMLDKWSLYSIAQYCDVMVPDGEGGLEPRFTCNVYINNRFEAYDCLMQLAGVFRGIMYWSGTAIIAGCDRPQDPVFTYTRANIIGEFNYSGTRTRDRHSVVMVSFDDPKNNYKTDKEVVSDRKAISEIGVRTKDLAAFACTSRGQAQRAGKWALFKEQLETRIVTFALGMDGYIAPVGRVIEIADPLLAGRAVGGRIAAVSADKKTITLDRDTTVKVGDRLVLNNEEGEQESRQVSSVSGRNITVAVAFDSPAVQHVWAVDSDDLQLMRFTVISVTENRSQDSINFTVTALQHEPALHEVADYSAYIERNNYSVIDITTQKAPAEVLISSNNRINQGIDITDLVISWKQAENAVKYHVQWRRDDGNWIQMPLQYGNQVTIENVYHGVYEAKVVAINAADVNSLPTSSLPTLINSKFAAPAALASLSATGILLGVELNWKFPLYGAQNAAFVEIYWALNADKSDEKLLGSYAYPTSETTINGLAPHLTLHFRARLVDRNGVASEYTPWVSATVDANPEKLIDLISGHISESTLDQMLKGKIDGAGALAGEANSLASQANAAAANAQNTANQATVKAQEAANAVVQEAIDRAAAIQDGITQVTTDYRAGDTAVLGELVAYKTSNDSAMATVVQKAESAVAAGSTNSQAITELTGQVQAINDTKLDASVISNYYTKGQADDKSAEIAAGKIESYNANLVIGGDNLLTETKTFNKAGTLELSKTTLRPNYAGFGSAFITDPDSMLWRTHTVVQVRRDWCGFYYSCNSDNPADWFADQDMTLSVWVKNMSNADVTAYGIVPAIGLVATIPIGEWQRIEMRIEKGRPLRNSNNQGIIEFHFASTEGAFYYAAPMLQYGNAVTAWQPSAEEVQNAIDANASSIQSTNADVSRIDGVVTSQANSISLLQSSLSDVDVKANTAINNAATAQQTANTAVTAVEANAGIITRLESSLASGVGTRNYLLNSAEVGTAKVISEDFNFMELEIGDVIQMSFDIDITSPVSSGSSDRIGYELYSPLQDGGRAWVGVWLHGVSSLGVIKQRVNNSYTVVSKFTTNPKNFSYYVQTEGGAFTVKNVQLTVSKIPVKTWSAAPEDLATASVLNNYYTKAEADNVVAGKVEQFSSTIAVGGANLWSVVKATRVSEYGSHSVRVNREEEEEVWITVESLAGDMSLIRFDSCLVDQNTPFIEGEDVVLSFEASCSGYNRLGTVYAYVGNAYSAIFDANLALDPRVWKRVVHKFKASGGGGVTGTRQLLGFKLHSADGWNVGTTLSIRHVQLQRGNTATAFSKAPAIARATIKETTQSINGIEAIKTVTIDNNGVMSGYGLISELKNGQVTSSFGVNANTFYIGSPSLDKKPFVQRNDWSVINGVWVPPGTYIDTAYIGNSTIGTAHITDLAVNTAKIDNGAITTAKIGDAQITSAKIDNAAITTAKIGDLQVDTAKIKDAAVDAAKIKDLAVDTLKIKDNAVSATIVVSKAAYETSSTISSAGSYITYPKDTFLSQTLTGFTPNAKVLLTIIGKIYVTNSYNKDTMATNTTGTIYVSVNNTNLYYFSISSNGSIPCMYFNSSGSSTMIATADASGNILVKAYSRIARVTAAVANHKFMSGYDDLTITAMEIKK